MAPRTPPTSPPRKPGPTVPDLPADRVESAIARIGGEVARAAGVASQRHAKKRRRDRIEWLALHGHLNARQVAAAERLCEEEEDAEREAYARNRLDDDDLRAGRTETEVVRALAAKLRLENLMLMLGETLGPVLDCVVSRNMTLGATADELGNDKTPIHEKAVLPLLRGALDVAAHFYRIKG